jgi:uncharacterized protein YndB with AHSA1/START domain
MGVLRIERTTSATPDQVWQVVTDWSGYARWMPLTTMRLAPGPTRVGWTFTGLSGLGRLRFADVMVITSWAPPRDGRGRFRLRKIGRLLDGWADVRVEPGPGGAGAMLHWTEELLVRPPALGRRLDHLADPVNRWMFGHAVDAMVAEAEALAVNSPA